MDRDRSTGSSTAHSARAVELRDAERRGWELGDPELDHVELRAPELLDVWLVPRPRVVGPGRRERAYQERLRVLEQEHARRARELEIAGAVERGSSRLLDRLEGELERRAQEAAELLRAQRRLLVALGSMQRENELLRASLAARPAALLAGADGARSRRGAARAWLSRCVRAFLPHERRRP